MLARLGGGQLDQEVAFSSFCLQFSTVAQQAHVAIPRRVTTPAKEMMLMQLRMQRTKGKRVLGLLGQPRFRAAYDFLLLREQAGEDLEGLGKFWTELQEKHPDVVAEGKNREDSTPRPRRRRRRKRPQ